MSGRIAGAAGTTALGVGSPLVTDPYQVTMALVYLREGLTAPATFSLITRELGPDRGFLVAAGLADVLDHLERFHIGEGDLDVFADLLACWTRPRRPGANRCSSRSCEPAAGPGSGRPRPRLISHLRLLHLRLP
ncbi:hypothetical protein BJF90_35295 [Pseudonocardia sp. CNS-004]|nr:hypothetical protein BJF90_35295 [Pseudonocardia sp. CNS-004]